jgi:hypothetical protein
MRLRDEAALATGQAGSTLGQRSASWRFLEFTLAATSGRSPIKKSVSPTAGSKVQLTSLGVRSRR